VSTAQERDGSGPDFAGMTVVITGGAGGIGGAVGAGFAARGATVVLADVVAPAVTVAPAVPATPDATATPVGTAGSAARTHTRIVDVADPVAVRALMAEVHASLGGPHVLVTLAGGSLGTPRDLPDITETDFDLVLDVNVKGTFLCCQAAAPFMADAGGGAMITCSSIGARQPSPVTGAAYATAKAAIGGLTRRLARELGPAGIRVNAVAPGLFLTPRLARRFDAMAEPERREVLDAIPLGRMPELREIVDPILFLAGPGASFITGVTLDVNGGRYLPA
jgi:NAD(P)-dependent dehydrogenase (short-subunit alcohol dehydrogenase family)